MRRFLMVQRQYGRAVLMIHHDNKRGQQRGSSRHEDALDLTIALRPPRGWTPASGAACEIHFEKARSLHGASVAPIGARLEAQGDRLVWRGAPIGGPAPGERLDRAVPLLRQGMSGARMGAALGLSRSAAYRLRDRARRLGHLDDQPRQEHET
jgi:putative DNA primase/helicase